MRKDSAVKKNTVSGCGAFRRIFVACVCACFVLGAFTSAAQSKVKNILILVEGDSDIKHVPMATGRQLATLLGHFDTKSTIKGVSQYTAGEVNNYDFAFYYGDSFKNIVPEKFLSDILTTKTTIVWMGTGFIDFSRAHDCKKKFGYSVASIDSIIGYDIVKSGNSIFTRIDRSLGVIQIADKNNVQVLATAYSSLRKKETPYIVRSKNLYYIADSPFAYATETDRYLLFADMLHDILGEQHDEVHSALIRIEDISPVDNPDKIREIADLLSKRGIPFLIGVIPYYVNPGTGLRVSLSEKPDMVDALKYAARNGGSLIMHGSTHQYKGVTASDFEFWDQNTNRPIKDENEAEFSRKIEDGIQQFLKNGLFPIVWETPHYTASFLFYRTVAKYFSSAMEPRLAIEDFDQSQYFPYIIKKDLFGQKIYPENLGYVPYDTDVTVGEEAVKNILKGAKASFQVRDGFAACFFHSFNDLKLLEQIVDGITAMGYTYVDLREQPNWVKTKDRVILTGTQSYSIRLADQYLVESYYSKDGEIKQKVFSDNRITGSVSKSIVLEPGEVYYAEPSEYKEKKRSLYEKVKNQMGTYYHNLAPSNENWKEARVVILWNHFAKGGAFNDEASLGSIFKSVNINVDTLFLGQEIDLSNYNLVVVPHTVTDSLSEHDQSQIAEFVQQGGNLVLDGKSQLAEKFNIRFTKNDLKVSRIRDKSYPEESIVWRYSELVNKIDLDDNDEILCEDEITRMPMMIGKEVGSGKLIYINSRFDPYTQNGYSLYPYLVDHVAKYLALRPIVRRDNLEMFFDPGFRKNFSVENLVKQWVAQGIRIIHVAGWHQYPKYNYDYERLITLAHANGILVYAWLEPPQVSQKFWNEHPAWREKNYLNEDVQPSFRFPIALTSPACVDAVTKEFETLLTQFDWDGVDLAELYFDAGKGLEEPNLFTPMHPSARAEVLKKYGIVLNDIFTPSSPFYWRSNPFVKKSIVDYRVEKLSEVYDALLSAISRIASKKPGFEIIVTAMDELESPELRDYLGVDMNSILSLQKKYDFTLQIEDPEHLWSTNPLRYAAMGNRYSALMGGDSRLMLDLNILSFRKENAITPFPTLIQTGTESYHLVQAASAGVPRFTIYAESSVNAQDLAYFPYASSSGVKYSYVANGYEFDSPYSFSIKLPKSVKAISVDGILVAPFRQNMFTIPAGVHEALISDNSVASFSTYKLQARILSFTGNVRSVAYEMKSITIAYEAGIRALISMDREPTSVTVDGSAYAFTVMKGNDCYSVFLPSGSHTVVIMTGDAFVYGMNITALWSSTGIAIFGSVAVGMLVIMFIVLKIVKRKYSV